MAIAVVGMLDEREEALRLIKDQIEQRGHKTLLIDISIGTGAIVPSLKADVSCRELAQLGGGPAEGVAAMLMGQRDRAISIMAEGLTKKIAAAACGRRSSGDPRHLRDDRRSHRAACHESLALWRPEAYYFQRGRIAHSCRACSPNISPSKISP